MQYILIADAIRCPQCRSALGLHENLTYCYHCKVHFLWGLQRDDDPNADNNLQLVFEMRNGTPPVFAGTLPPAPTIQPEPHPDTIPADPVGECDYSDLLPTPEKTNVSKPIKTPTPVQKQHTPQNDAPPRKQPKRSAISILTGTPRPKHNDAEHQITDTDTPTQQNKYRHKDIANAIVAYLKEKKAPARTGEMLDALKCAKSNLNNALKQLEEDQILVKVKHGVWMLQDG